MGVGRVGVGRPVCVPEHVCDIYVPFLPVFYYLASSARALLRVSVHCSRLQT